jgi:hypothetical protein
MDGHHLDADPAAERHHGNSGSDPDRHKKTMPIDNTVLHRNLSVTVSVGDPDS